jgi:hypothetical protein
MKRCDFCGERFGLITYRHLWKRFCRKRCKENYFAAQARKIDSKKQQWATVLAKPSSN